MSPTELVRDALLDLRAIANKLKPIGDKQEREHRKLKDRSDLSLSQFIRWRSPRGNNWFFVLTTTKSLGTTVASMVWYRGSDSRLRAAVIDVSDTATHLHLSAHVIERYGQRFNPDNDPLERLADFFQANHSLAITCTKDLGNGRHKVVCGVVHGQLQGYGDTTTRMVELTTFVDPSLFHPEQVALDEELEMQRWINTLSMGQKSRLMREVARKAA